VASAGGVNGDGFDDLLIGARLAEDGAANDEGETYLVFGGAARLTALDAADGTSNGSLDLAFLTAATGFRLIGRDANDSVSRPGGLRGPTAGAWEE
jgi:FG-GAP repeat